MDEVYIYSDVCGIFTGDPKYINEARLIKAYWLSSSSWFSQAQSSDHLLQSIDGNLYKKMALKIKLRSFKDDRIGTLINHDDTNIRTMSIDFNYWLIRLKKQ